METKNIDFSNQVLSKKYFWELTKTTLGLFFLDICYVLTIFLLEHYLEHMDFDLHRIIIDCGKGFLNSIGLALVFSFFLDVPRYRNKYLIQNGSLTIKEYEFFIPTMEATIPLNNIRRSSIQKKKSFLGKTTRLAIQIENKEYTLCVENKMTELNKFIQNYINQN